MARPIEMKIDFSRGRAAALAEADAVTNDEARETAIAQWVQQVFAELQIYKWSLPSIGEDHAELNELYDMYRQHRSATRRVRNNMMFQLLQEQLPIFYNVGVNIESHPRQPDDTELAVYDQDIIDLSMKEIDIAEKDRQASNSTLKAGYYVGKVWYDAYENGGRGRLMTQILDVRNVFFDENATRDMDSVTIAIIASVIPTDKLKKLYPKKADVIEAGDSEAARFDNSRTIRRRGVENQPQNQFRSQSLVLECWIMDPDNPASTGEELGDNPDGAAGAAAPRKYPDGRVITVNGNTILQDRPNPFAKAKKGHGKLPLFLGQCYDVDDRPEGQGDLEVLKEDQIELDNMDTIIRANTRLLSMPWIVISKETKIKKITLSNRPGIVLQPNKTRDAAGIGFVTPPGLQRDVFTRADALPLRMRKRIGMDEFGVDLIRERTQAVGTMRIAQESNQQRVMGKIDNKNRGWARWAMLARACWRQFGQEQTARLISGKHIKVRRAMLDAMDVDKFDTFHVPAGKQIASQATNFAVQMELDKIGVLGAPEAMARRRLLAESSGSKGVMKLLNEEEDAMKEEAAAAAPAPPAPAPRANMNNLGIGADVDPALLEQMIGEIENQEALAALGGR